MTAPRTIHYVYGILGDGVNVASAPRGIDGTPVTVVRSDELCALASVLDSDEYAPAMVEERAGNVEWLAPRAEAHDAVVSWAGDPGPVVPLHMWTLFSDERAVQRMLASSAGELKRLLDRLRGADEYGLRVYADAAQLEQHVAGGEAGAGELERTAAAGGPGQRYLVGRRLQRTRRDAARAFAQSTADRIQRELGAESVDSMRDELPVAGTAEAGAVFSGAFLVRRDALSAFRAALTPLVRELEPQGFRFAFTGPWPPYHFTSGAMQ